MDDKSSSMMTVSVTGLVMSSGISPVAVLPDL